MGRPIVTIKNLSRLDHQSVLKFTCMLKYPFSVPFRGVRIWSPNIIRAVDKREYLVTNKNHFLYSSLKNPML